MTFTPKFVGAEAVNKEVKLAVNATGKWQDRVTAIAESALYHVLQHGDWRPLRDLVVGISKSQGVKKTALITWSEDNLNATLEENIETGKLDFVYKARDNSGVLFYSSADIDMESAVETPWHEYKRVTAPVYKSIEDLMEDFIKQAVKSVKHGAAALERCEAVKAAFEYQVVLDRQERDAVAICEELGLEAPMTQTADAA